MRKNGCNKQKLPVLARRRNGDISLFQRFLKMDASTADCIRQRAESIPELHQSETSGDGAHQRLKRRKSMKPSATQAATSSTRRISTQAARIHPDHAPYIWRRDDGIDAGSARAGREAADAALMKVSDVSASLKCIIINMILAERVGFDPT